ncbi:MAG: hypothetical protein KatS3mg002_0095 [Candidatus Woesearchaeota archaeon]|nr:MAG: hypothetical protein KatS3mg002_0095 [Candidatus Woesearchaeota archaeon]
MGLYTEFSDHKGLFYNLYDLYQPKISKSSELCQVSKVNSMKNDSSDIPINIFYDMDLFFYGINEKTVKKEDHINRDYINRTVFFNKFFGI